MDFKVAGTVQGVTALQMDIKVKGITYKVMEKALAQAKVARLAILGHLTSTIAAPRADLSPHAPRMLTIKIPTEKIGAIIGPGGSVIRKMIEEFGVSIDVSDDGTVVIGSADKDAAEGARAQIQSMTREAEIGAIYQGKVVRIMPFGAFVQILPGKDGLVHISELSDQRVPTVESVVQIGDPLEVVVTNVDHLGRVDLSARAAAELRKRNAEPGGNASGQLDLNEFRPKRAERPMGGDGDRGGRGRFGGGGGGRGPGPRFGDRGDRDFDRPPPEPAPRPDFNDRPPREAPPARGLQDDEPVQDAPAAPDQDGDQGPRPPVRRRQVGGFRGGRPMPPPSRR
jgi:polyribonucleotide nucleotidyltransferase